MPSRTPLLHSEVESVFTGHGHYILEFSCGSIPQEMVPINWWLQGLRVVGTQHYRARAQQFIRNDPVGVRLVREPFNLHDSNAIRIQGVSRKGDRYKIGYLPAELSEPIVRRRLLGSLAATITLAQISASGFTFVNILLYGTREARQVLMPPELLGEIAQKEKEERENEKVQREFATLRSLEDENPDGAIAGYRELLRRPEHCRPPESALYERISISYKKQGDLAKVVETLEEYARIRERKYYPISQAKLNRLNRSRKKIGLPELEPWYQERISARRTLRPELFPELNAISVNTWAAALRSDLRTDRVSLYNDRGSFYGSLKTIRVTNQLEWTEVKQLLPGLRLSSVYVEGQDIVCVLLPTDASAGS